MMPMVTSMNTISEWYSKQQIEMKLPGTGAMSDLCRTARVSQVLGISASWKHMKKYHSMILLLKTIFTSLF